MMLIAMAWGLFAMLMFFMRPASMRRSDEGNNRDENQLEGKPSNVSGGNNVGPKCLCAIFTVNI
jgi:hypothetical protein